MSMYFAEYTYRRADNGEFSPWEARLRRTDDDKWIVRLFDRKGEYMGLSRFLDQTKADAYARRRIFGA